MLLLPKYSFGVGDRFAQSARAQLEAFQLAAEAGIDVTPVWNKSNREHLIVGSEPSETRTAAKRAVEDVGWGGDYFLDADHINNDTVDRFLAPCDFFTIDVADWIGRPVPAERVDRFLGRHTELIGELTIEGIDRSVPSDREAVARTAGHYLAAVSHAGEIYRHIEDRKGPNFITEISMDETDRPQGPQDLLVILAAVADEGIPVQTIAPKFTGRFNKGVDYVGDPEAFAMEFDDDVCVIAHAVETYRLLDNLKLSVHTGSDKFSLYGRIRRALQKSDAGVHVKTAGTSWLEEVIGLAESGGDGLRMAKKICTGALAQREALCAPYATVIDIDASKLPSVETVAGWTAQDFMNALRHDPSHNQYNSHLRQLLHVGYKIAAGFGADYRRAVRDNAETVARNVTANLFERHMKPLFGGV